MKYLYLFFVLNEIKSLKTGDIINLYNLLQSKNLFLGMPVVYSKQSDHLVIQLNIDLSKIILPSYPNMSNEEFLNEVENSIKNICNVLDYLEKEKTINEVENTIKLIETQKKCICDRIISDEKYVKFFEKEYKLTDKGRSLLNQIFYSSFSNNE